MVDGETKRKRPSRPSVGGNNPFLYSSDERKYKVTRKRQWDSAMSDDDTSAAQNRKRLEKAKPKPTTRRPS